MAQSRIFSLDHETNIIQYYYDDHKTNKRIEVKEHVFEFMKKLIQHIPEPQFKMTRYAGIYATCHHKHRNTVTALLGGAFKRIAKKLTYRQELIDVFNVDPLLCDCGHYLEYVDF